MVSTRTERSSALFERSFLVALARAFGGALIFGLPLLMTMEMWALGFRMQPLRLALFLTLMFPLLVVLAYAGFEESVGWQHGAQRLRRLRGRVRRGRRRPRALGVLRPGMSLGDRRQDLAPGHRRASGPCWRAVSSASGRNRRMRSGGGTRTGELFLATVGALFLAFNVAPTEEVLISTMMTGWHALAIIGVSLAIMHAFVYAVEFRGRTRSPPSFRCGASSCASR